MTYLYATLHTLGVSLRDRAAAAHRQGRERGSVTSDIVYWVVALLGLAGLACAAIQALVNNQISDTP